MRERGWPVLVWLQAGVFVALSLLLVWYAWSAWIGPPGQYSISRYSVNWTEWQPWYWEFDSRRDLADWPIIRGGSYPLVSDGALQTRLGSEPVHLISRKGLQIASSNFSHLYLRFRLEPPEAGPVFLFWSGSAAGDAPFELERSVMAQLPTETAGWQELLLPLHEHPAWTGSITRLMLRFPGNSGELALDRACLLDKRQAEATAGLEPLLTPLEERRGTWKLDLGNGPEPILSWPQALDGDAVLASSWSLRFWPEQTGFLRLPLADLQGGTRLSVTVDCTFTGSIAERRTTVLTRSRVYLPTDELLIPIPIRYLGRLDHAELHLYLPTGVSFNLGQPEWLPAREFLVRPGFLGVGMSMGIYELPRDKFRLFFGVFAAILAVSAAWSQWGPLLGQLELGRLPRLTAGRLALVISLVASVLHAGQAVRALAATVFRFGPLSEEQRLATRYNRHGVGEEMMHLIAACQEFPADETIWLRDETMRLTVVPLAVAVYPRPVVLWAFPVAELPSRQPEAQVLFWRGKGEAPAAPPGWQATELLPGIVRYTAPEVQP